MKLKATFFVVTLSSLGFSTAAFADDPKWAPPNVIGMPGYHEPSPKPAVTSAVATWDSIAGNWKVIVGKVKEKWGQLTDDELTQIDGKRESLEGRLQLRYGYTKEQAAREVDDWMRTHR